MSKSIFEAAKQVEMVVMVNYDVRHPGSASYIWPHANAWLVTEFGQCPSGEWVISQMFNDSDHTIELFFETREQLREYVDRILNFPE